MSWESFVRKHPPLNKNMSVEQFLKKYPPRSQMDATKMGVLREIVRAGGTLSEKEAQQLAWYDEHWIEPQDRLSPSKPLLISLREKLVAMKAENKTKSKK